MSNNISAIIEGLNDEQKAAVQCVDGPVLIVAGAGSGKTRVLTSRIAYLLENGVPAGSILALTFTRKAASEMKERISTMVGERRARHLCMGTFHSVFIRFLREFAQSLGYPEGFTVYDTADSTGLIKQCIKELQLDDKVYKPKDVLSRISMAKNNLVTEAAYRNNTAAITADTASRKPRICDIYTLYAGKCKQAGVMDFDDILLNMNILLRDNSEALETIGARFSHIMVDEYQDTNFAQYLILRKLAAKHRNICVVGDDSQSIYAFRGAKIENILNFRKDYPESRIFRLECNYRSTKNIVNAANSLIARNEGRIPKDCYSRGEEGERIRLIRSYTEQEEAILVSSSITARIRDDKAEYKDFAILYRTNSQSRALEEALRRRNLPYMIYSGNSFFERAEVKDVMAYFKLAVNTNDDEAFRRVVNRPARGIGDTSMNALQQAALASGVSLFKAASLDNLNEFGLRDAGVAKIREFCRMVDGFASKAALSDAHELALSIASDSGIWAFYKSDTSIEGMSRTSNVEELLNSVASFVEERSEELEEEDRSGETVTLGDFLENVSLLSNVDISEDEDSTNRISMMTVHSAKGLEFKYVFIVGMEENLFPNSGMLSGPAEIEEERRLFYVALTRAMKAVVLSYADTRMRNGQHESNAPSRFIREIDPKYISNPLRAKDAGEENMSTSSLWGRTGAAAFRKTQTAAASGPVYSGKAAVLSRPVPARIDDPDFVPAQMTEFRAGDRIEHNRFGKGRINTISGSYPEFKAQISFDDYGDKIILLKYAKMRILK